MPTPVEGSLTADAVLKRAQSSSLTADAVARKSWLFDGITFTGRAFLSGTFALQDVAYGNGVWVAVGTSGVLYTATDPLGTWTSRTSSFGSDSINGVAYDGGVWVAVGNSGKIATATDPTGTWTQRSNSFSSVNITAVAYGNGLWVAVGASASLATAPDPTSTWTSQTSNFTAFGTIQEVSYGGGYYVACGSSGDIITSPDGTTWAQVSNPFGSSNVFGLYYAGGVWVAVGDGGKLATATDPTGTWTSRTSGMGSNAIRAVAFGNGVWTAVGAGTTSTGHISTATNPTGTWTKRTSPYTSNLTWNGVWSADGKTVIVGNETSAPAKFAIARLPLTADAVIRKTLAGSFTANARIVFVRSGSLTANAVLRRAQTGSLTADATITSAGTTPVEGSFTADALIRKARTGSFTANALIRKARTGSLSASAVIRVARTGSFTADAILVVRHFTADALIRRAALDLGFTADAAIRDPSLTQQADGLPRYSDVVILHEGVDITASVMLRDASFIALVNGAVGTCQFFVKDPDHSFSFAAGDEITLDIQGNRMWGGYLMRAKRMYFFPVQDTTNADTVVRGWQIEGVDYNILFRKRIVFDADHPTTKTDFTYPAGSWDDDIIKDIFDNYLDLTGLGITRTGVTRVARAILDIAGAHHVGTVASAGHAWGDAMSSISRATGAVYYISPTKVLTYVDVDVPDTVWVLNDQPTGEWDLGLRELEIPYNGTNLVNDMLVWGAALGVDHIAFSRAEDATSETEHGRWQDGLFTAGLYRQANVDLVADSYVYGTPQSKRGGKDDQISFVASLFQPVLMVGQKIRCISAIYGFDDVLPIRRMEITFPTKPKEPNTGYPKMKLTISHEIDLPWSMFEQPPLRWQPFGGWKPPVFPPWDSLPPPEDGVGECDCGTTDSFTRTVAGFSNFNYPPVTGLIGTGESGIEWDVARYNGTSTVSLDGSTVKIDATIANGSAPQFAAQKTGLWRTQYNTVKTVRFSFSDLPAGSKSFTFGGQMAGIGWYAYIDVRTGSLAPFSQFGFLFSNFVIIPSDFWVAGDIYTVTQVDNGTNTTNLITNGTATYSITKSVPATSPLISQISFAAEGEARGITASQDVTFRFYDIDIPEVTVCTEGGIYDNFRRTVASGWGTASSGDAWTVSGTGTGTTSVTTFGGLGHGRANLNAAVQRFFQTPDDGPWQTGSGFTLTFLFLTDLLGTGSDFTLLDVTDADGTVELFIQMGAGSGNGISIYSNTSDSVAKTDWLADNWYWAKLEFVPGSVARAKVWTAEEDEPTGWDVTADAYGHAVPASMPMIWNVGAPGNGAAEIRITSIDFDYAGKPCPGNVPILAFTTSSGRTREQPTTTDDLTFQLKNAFIMGSTEVYVNGFRKTRITDYTEDSAAGTITFAASTTGFVFVVYIANGAPV